MGGSHPCKMPASDNATSTAFYTLHHARFRLTKDTVWQTCLENCLAFWLQWLVQWRAGHRKPSLGELPQTRCNSPEIHIRMTYDWIAARGQWENAMARNWHNRIDKNVECNVLEICQLCDPPPKKGGSKRYRLGRRTIVQNMCLIPFWVCWCCGRVSIVGWKVRPLCSAWLVPGPPGQVMWPTHFH